MTDHLAAIIAAAQCQRPVECRNGHSDWCNAARKVAVRDALREALGSAEVVDMAGDAVLDALCDSPVWQDRHIGELEQHLADGFARASLAAAVAAVGGASC